MNDRALIEPMQHWSFGTCCHLLQMALIEAPENSARVSGGFSFQRPFQPGKGFIMPQPWWKLSNSSGGFEGPHGPFSARQKHPQSWAMSSFFPIFRCGRVLQKCRGGWQWG